jgi:hypothetical protein
MELIYKKQNLEPSKVDNIYFFLIQRKTWPA